MDKPMQPETTTPDEAAVYEPPTAHDTQPVRTRHRRRSRSRWGRLRRRLFGRRLLRNLAFGLVLAVIVLAVGQAVLIFDAVNQLSSSYDNLNRVLSNLNTRQGGDLTLNDFTRLQTSINDTSRSIDLTQSRVQYVRPLATVNPEWVVLLSQLDTARALTSATQDVLAGLQPTLFFLVGGSDSDSVVTQISAGARIVEQLEIGRSRFLRAEERLGTARGLLDGINLTQAPPQTLLQIDQLNQLYDRLKDTNDLLLDAPELLTFALGLDTPRSYLVLANNSDELRPSGGYTSTYGWLVMRNGRVVEYDYSPTTADSPAPPPEDSAVDFEVPSWWIQYSSPVYAAWDGSWHADFPSTAEMAMWYYNAGNNVQSPVSGALSIDLVGFEYLLRALGDVRVPGYDRTINAANFRDVVYNIRAFGQGVSPHKRFVADVYRAIFAEWQSASGDPDTNNRLLGALLQALQERHIMLHFSDPNLNHAVDLLNWSGRQLVGTGHDYVMVADANLGNKSNSSIIREMTLDVQIQTDGSAESVVSLSYEYPASLAIMDPAVDPEYHGPLDYNNLLQVFVPPGSTLNENSGLRTPPTVEDTDEFTHFISRTFLEYDTVERFQFRYRTPPVLEPVGDYQRYRLLIQKQPGMRAERVNVQLGLPADARIVSVSPQPAQSYNLDQLILDFRLNLTTDQWIEVTYGE
jgi:hypothetical protein